MRGSESITELCGLFQIAELCSVLGDEDIRGMRTAGILQHFERRFGHSHGIQSVRQVHQHRFEQFRFYIPFSEEAAKTSLDVRTTPTGRNPPLVKIFDDR